METMETPQTQPQAPESQPEALPRAPFPRHLSQRLTVERLVQHAGHITEVHNNLASQVSQQNVRIGLQFSAHADRLSTQATQLRVHEGRLELHSHSLSSCEAKIPCGHGLWARLRWLATGK
jgi:hypothetical protein